ncbi:MAG: nucleotidyltransferase family protein [Clostridium sp.]|nr:nucleotidyltransferase family protein [Clostridium sp.]
MTDKRQQTASHRDIAIEKVLFAMLRNGMWTDRAPETPTLLTRKQWDLLYEEARKQTLCGILFDGYKRWPENARPYEELHLKWVMRIHRMEEQNRKMNRASVWVTNNFLHEGFRSCILKGQGVATFYPNPLHRQAGDIDVWVEGGRERVLNYLKSIGPVGEVVYHHIEFPIHKEVDIEVHTTPTWLNNPIRNRKLQQLFRTQSEACFSHTVTLVNGGQIFIPSDEINQIYLLIHIYRHLFDEGVGLRQLVDYALMMDKTFTLRNSEILHTHLKQLGLQTFAEAVFHILIRYLGYPAEKSPVSPSSRHGESLMQEIMMGGNFGHHDIRNRHAENETVPQRFLRKVKRNLRFILSYPEESLSSPLFKTAHYLWRLKNGYL